MIFYALLFELYHQALFGTLFQNYIWDKLYNAANLKFKDVENRQYITIIF